MVFRQINNLNQVYKAKMTNDFGHLFELLAIVNRAKFPKV